MLSLAYGRFGLDVGEGPHQLAVHLLDPPRQQPVLLHHLLAELGDRRVLVLRQRVERRRAEGVHVEEVLRRFLDPAGGAPQVGIDRVLGDEGAMLHEEGPDRRRQQVDGAIGDQAVRLEAPGGGPLGRGRGGGDGDGEQGGSGGSSSGELPPACRATHPAVRTPTGGGCRRSARSGPAGRRGRSCRWSRSADPVRILDADPHRAEPLVRWKVRRRSRVGTTTGSTATWLELAAGVSNRPVCLRGSRNRRRAIVVAPPRRRRYSAAADHQGLQLPRRLGDDASTVAADGVRLDPPHRHPARPSGCRRSGRRPTCRGRRRSARAARRTAREIARGPGAGRGPTRRAEHQERDARHETPPSAGEGGALGSISYHPRRSGRGALHVGDDAQDEVEDDAVARLEPLGTASGPMRATRTCSVSSSG